MLMLKPEEAESKESFKNTQIRAGEDIENEMAAEKNPRKRREHRPEPNHKDNPIEKLSLIGEVSESGDEEDARGVAAGEGEMVDGNGGVHVLVVDRAGSAEEELDEGDENEVEEEAEEEGGDEGPAEEGGGGGIGGEEEGEGDWEEEAEIGGEFEEEEEEVWEESVMWNRGDGEDVNGVVYLGWTKPKTSPTQPGECCFEFELRTTLG
ncbi:hypothetical protein FCV25MIE_25302 [Fagus crenata]